MITFYTLLAFVIATLLGILTGHHANKKTKYLVPLLIIDAICLIIWLTFVITYFVK